MAHAMRQSDFLGWDSSMRVPFAASAVFHALLFIFAVVGLPYVVTPPDVPSKPVSVEIVNPSDVETTPFVAPPTPKQKEPEIPKPPAQQKPAPPQMTQSTPPDLLNPKPPEEKTPDKAEPLPPPEPLKKEAPKPPPPKAKKKPEDITKKAEEVQTQNFQSLLKNLMPSEAAQKVDAPDISEKTQPQQSQIAQLSDQISASEQDALRRQLAGCWNVMAGAKYAEELVVEVRVTVNPDRTVQQTVILDQARYNLDSHFRAAADAALRALKNPKCSPLELPPEKYAQWKTTVIRFDPRAML